MKLLSYNIHQSVYLHFFLHFYTFLHFFLQKKNSLTRNKACVAGLQSYMQRIQRTQILGTIICVSRKVLSHLGLEPTTLGVVECRVATA